MLLEFSKQTSSKNPVKPNFAGNKAISTFVSAEKYYATADRWLLNQEAALALKKPTIAMSMTCSSKILCNNRQVVLYSKNPHFH